MNAHPGNLKDNAPPKALRSTLYLQVLAAIVAGAALGHFAPEFGAKLKPLGDAFVKLVGMLAAPIIFTTVVLGLAGMGDLKKVGRLGLKAIIEAAGLPMFPEIRYETIERFGADA